MRWLITIAQTLLIIGLTIYFVRALDARNQMPLHGEHRVQIADEFAALEDLDWQGYQRLEDDLVRQLSTALAPTQTNGPSLSRHAPGSRNDPRTAPIDFNLSYEITTMAQAGVAVLVHGLTDSPYSMRTTAEQFAAAGYHVYAPRLPGHGLAVGQLRHARHEDWLAAVSLTMQAAASRRQPGEPLVLGGYSTGGALSLYYAMICQGRDDLPCPDGLILIAPAVAVPDIALLARLHNLVSWIPFFEQFQYESVLPESDPFKYMSFPKNAGWEVAELTWLLQDRYETTLPDLPPILAFQSIIDTTIRARALFELLATIPAGGHELVIYDINRNRLLTDTLNRDYHTPERLLAAAPLPFDLTVISNAAGDSNDTISYHLAADENDYAQQPTGIAWPVTVYSLSHAAIPFPPDDPLYGEDGQALSAVDPKGEPSILRIPSDYFLRVRYNPFMDWQARKVTAWLTTIGSKDG